MYYVDKYTRLNFYEDDLAYGDALIKENRFKKGKLYRVGIDKDKMILLSPTSKSDYAGLTGIKGCYYLESGYHNSNDGSITVTALYSVKHHKFLDVKNAKLISLYKKMYWLGNSTGYDFIFPLSLVNYEDLGILSEEEKRVFINYLKSGNNKISDDEVINCILKGIPKLERYRNLKKGLTVSEYRDIINDIGMKEVFFRPIPQDLEFLQDDKSIHSDYRHVFLPEEELKEKTLTYKRRITGC